MDSHGTGRRPLLIALGGGAAALGATAVAARVFGGDGGDEQAGGRSLTLSAGPDNVESLEVLLDDDLLPATGNNKWRSTELGTSVHSLVGFTWQGDASPELEFRPRTKGTWGEWRSASVLHDEPDGGEGVGTHGTDLAFIGAGDGIQIRLTGPRPPKLTLVLLHPKRIAGDTDPIAPPASRIDPRFRTARQAAAPVPSILTRKQWGANEGLRDGSPRYNTTIQQVHVHHTVNGNDYSKVDVPGLIRGMYSYHTRSLGWSDIGYNFLVDRFGRVWEGRYGGAARAVRGAHTLGFNDTSAGISVIGNFETGAPNSYIVNAVASVAAWKLAYYDRDPKGVTSVRSTGSDKYGSGRTVRLPVIDGHRDTNDTACPGSKLYAQLPAIRNRAAALVKGGASSPAKQLKATSPAKVSGVALLGKPVSVTPGAYNAAGAKVAYQWLRNGAAIPGATAATYTPVEADLTTRLSARVTAAKAGYQPATQTVGAPGVVSTSTQFVLTRKSRLRKGVVRIQVRGAGTKRVPARGELKVVLGTQRRKLTVVNGEATARFKNLPVGIQPLKIAYSGSAGFLASRKDGKMRIRRR